MPTYVWKTTSCPPISRPVLHICMPCTAAHITDARTAHQERQSHGERPCPRRPERARCVSKCNYQTFARMLGSTCIILSSACRRRTAAPRRSTTCLSLEKLIIYLIFTHNKVLVYVNLTYALGNIIYIELIRWCLRTLLPVLITCTKSCKSGTCNKSYEILQPHLCCG
jgi:hypothetical protein